MTKSPEEYFQEQDFSVEAAESSFSPAEKEFMEKYMGMSPQKALATVGLDAKKIQEEALPDVHKEMSAQESLRSLLRDNEQLQLVAFHLGKQEFVLPTIVVQEVIRAIPVTKLPCAQGTVAGVISLRGKVTPLIYLRDMLGVSSPREGEDSFIVICRRHGVQIGLLIERVHTMYHIPQKNIDWGIESTLGEGVNFVSGLVKINELLVGIVDVDAILASILEQSGVKGG